MVASPDNFSILVAVTDSVSFTNRTHNNLSYHIAQNAANDSPSPGGEAPVLLGKHSTFNIQLSTLNRLSSSQPVRQERGQGGPIGDQQQADEENALHREDGP